MVARGKGRAFAGVALALVAAAACSGRHDGLAVDLGAGGSEASGALGGGGTSGGAGTSGSTAATTSTTSSTSGTTSSSGAAGGSGAGGSAAADAGAPGPTTLTVVNGVNDADAVRLCFLGHPSGEHADAPPWPAKPLPFAAAATPDLASDLPAGVDVRPVVLAGDLANAAGKTCAELVAGVVGVRAVPLAVIPKAVFASGKRVLLVPNGCVGGPSHTDPSQAFGCGMGYAPDKPTASLVAVALDPSRDPAHVNLQLVHADIALPTVDVRVTPGSDAAASTLVASNLSVGAAGPKPPFADLGAVAYGAIAQAKLTTHPPNDPGTTTTSASLLGPLLAASGVDASSFVDGASFALVAVGGYPGLPAGPFWHALTYAVLPIAP